MIKESLGDRLRRTGIRFGLSHGVKAHRVDYREDLAAFSGDPAAMTNGPRSVERLKNRRQREGWDICPIADAPAKSRPELEGSDSFMKKAIIRAAKKCQQGYDPEKVS